MLLIISLDLYIFLFAYIYENNQFILSFSNFQAKETRNKLIKHGLMLQNQEVKICEKQEILKASTKFEVKNGIIWT